MTDEFKRIAHEIEDMSDAKPRSLTKTRAHRVARARLKSDTRRAVDDGLHAYETERQEADDNCGNPHCCECGDGIGCEGCFFCERACGWCGLEMDDGVCVSCDDPISEYPEDDNGQ